MDELFLTALVAAPLAMAAFVSCIQTHPDADEGYLWYGTLRLLEGQAPLRDFRSYEPGRYYWCAFWMKLLGFGLFALRIAVHGFYFFGLWAGLLALRLAGIEWPATIVTAALLTVWAYPHYKLFEPSLLMFALLAGVLFLVGPTLPVIFVAGLVVGGSAVFGLNCGLYNGAALFGLILLGIWKSQALALPLATAIFLLGGAIGIMPLLATFLHFPGTFDVFYQRRVRAVLARRSSNLALPLPWPWRPSTLALKGLVAIGLRVAQLYFILLPLFAVSVLVWAVLSSWPALQAQTVPVAAAMLCAFALHHAISRADLPHLSHAMVPLIVGLVALLSRTWFGWVLLILLFGWGGIATVLRQRPRVAWKKRLLRTDLPGARLWLTRRRAAFFNEIREAVSAYVGADGAFFAAPNLVMLYPLLGLRSPVYDIYCIYPASPKEEARMRRELEQAEVQLALINDVPFDGREELRFSRTHPAIWSWLCVEFSPLETENLPPHHHLLLRRARPATGDMNQAGDPASGISGITEPKETGGS